MADISLQVFGSNQSDAGYITWTPIPLKIVNHTSRTQTIKLTYRAISNSLTQLNFFDNIGDEPQEDITVQIGAESERILFVAGKFQAGVKHNGASEDSKDVEITAAFQNNPDVAIALLPLMVRVRKNANLLSDRARTDLLNALMDINGTQLSQGGPGPGNGVYTTDFVMMHEGGASDSEHGDSMFLPWHRLYLLDLERQLQQVNPAVSLPYWKFDEPAPNLFTQDFMGQMQQIPRDSSQPGGAFDPGGANTPAAIFSVDNPLSQWQIGSVQGIPRTARFDPLSQAANGFSNSNDGTDFPVLTQVDTMRLALPAGSNDPADAEFGARISGDPTRFSRMEGTPHGAAHVSFNGYINNVPVAPRDPLFFLLHCNVDRLWAIWQFIYDRDKKDDMKSYPYQISGDAVNWKLVDATQWPWDGSTSLPGGLQPPGTRDNNFTSSMSLPNVPGAQPKIEDSIDPFGQHEDANFLGFAYDDHPYINKATSPLPA